MEVGALTVSLENRRTLLVGLLGDTDAGVRAAAAAALEQLESLQELGTLIAALKAEKRGVRIKAIFAMEKIASPEVFPHLI
jgi:HEAT repeat protein